MKFTFKLKVKSLVLGLKKFSGRNNYGRITVFHKGGGHKKLYRFVDYKRCLFNIPGIILRKEYDPNRNCYLALIFYINNILSYILAPEDIKVGQTIISYNNINVFNEHIINYIPGNAFRLKHIPLGSFIHNIEAMPGQGGKIVRTAGNSATLLKIFTDFNKVLIKLKSGKVLLIDSSCYATLGILSNSNFNLGSLVKAGNSRWLGKKPVVRGVAMNPIDHPHGGGEGKTSGGRPSVSPWGLLTKGVKTKKKKKIKYKFGKLLKLI